MISIAAKAGFGIILLLQALILARLRAPLRKRGVSLSLCALHLGVVLAFALLLRLLFWLFDWRLEHDAVVLWLFACSTMFLASYGVAKKSGRLPTAELTLSVIFLVELVTAFAFMTLPLEGLAAPQWRLLMVAPAAFFLCAYFGASLAFLTQDKAQRGWGYEVNIGRRFLLAKSSPVISTVTTISLLGVSLGVWLVIVSLAILSGFENDLERKIIGTNAHVIVQQQKGHVFDADPVLSGVLQKHPGIAALSPIVEGEVALASSQNYTGGIVFGIDPTASARVLTILQKLQRGSLQPLEEEMNAAPAKGGGGSAAEEFQVPASTPSIVIGAELAHVLNVDVGDRIRLISPLLEVLTPLGVAPKSLGFRISGIFSSKMFEYDARYAFISLPAARRFFEYEEGEISAWQLAVSAPQEADRIARELKPMLEPKGLFALDWKGRNQTLFSALELERVVAFVVLVFIILVASFSIVNTLSMSVIEKRREIAILKTMGSSDSSIMKIFLAQGLLVGVLGTFTGACIAVITISLLQKYGFAIPGDVYYIDSLPVHLSVSDVVLVVLAALLIIWDFAVFPALQGAQLKPVEGLRDG